MMNQIAGRTERGSEVLSYYIHVCHRVAQCQALVPSDSPVPGSCGGGICSGGTCIIGVKGGCITFQDQLASGE